MSETKLAMAERHVREGAERLARQEELIATLDRDGRDNMLSKAYKLLAEFRSIQAMSKEHLARYRDEAGRVRGEDRLSLGQFRF